MSSMSIPPTKTHGQIFEKRIRQVDEVAGYLEESSEIMSKLRLETERHLNDYRVAHKVNDIPLKKFRRGLEEIESQISEQDDNISILVKHVVSKMDESVLKTKRPNMSHLYEKLVFFGFNSSDVEVSEKALTFANQYLVAAFNKLKNRIDIFEAEKKAATLSVMNGWRMYPVFESELASSQWFSMWFGKKNASIEENTPEDPPTPRIIQEKKEYKLKRPRNSFVRVEFSKPLDSSQKSEKNTISRALAILLNKKPIPKQMVHIRHQSDLTRASFEEKGLQTARKEIVLERIPMETKENLTEEKKFPEENPTEVKKNLLELFFAEPRCDDYNPCSEVSVARSNDDLFDSSMDELDRGSS